MAYDLQLAARVRIYLKDIPVEETKMFGGLAFLINKKMCINVSGNRLMCRFDPGLSAELSKKPGFSPMIMKGKELGGYCYVEPVGFKSKTDFEFWIGLCLKFNKHLK